MKKTYYKDKRYQKLTYLNRRRFGYFFLPIVILVFLIFSLRFIWIVSTHKANGVDLDQKQEVIHQSKTILSATRGKILDRNGEILAQDNGKFTISATTNVKAGKTISGNKAIPLYVTNKEAVVNLISNNLPISRKMVLNQLSKTGYQIRFGAGGDNIPISTKIKLEEEIKKNKITGIEFLRRPSRLYNGGIFASQIIGIADIPTKDEDKDSPLLEGKMGIEQQFNSQLKGINGYLEKKVNLQSSFGDRTIENRVNPKEGSDVYLTINSDFQKQLENLITNVNSAYKPNEMNAVMVEAKTGKIVAATQRPSFDANTLSGLSDMWRDNLVEDGFEPGSVFKAVTLSSAIDDHVYNPNQYYDSGSIKIGPNTIYDWQRAGWGLIPMSQAFPRSSNVGFVHLEQDIGANKWKDYIDKFGFTKKTGITLPNENPGSLQYKYTVDQAITSFGQGINVNVMQLVQAYTAIANGGQIIKPQIVDHIYNPNNKESTKFSIIKKNHPISSESASQTIDEMRRVVTEKYGTGQVYAIPNVDLALKTGTAEISEANGNGYMKGQYDYLYSVMGIYPAKSPRYILYISLKRPQNITKTPEEMLSEAFKPMVQYSLSYNKNYKELKNYSIKVPDLSGSTPNKAKSILNQQGLVPIVLGTGNSIVQQLPFEGTNVLSNQKVILLTNGAITMPNMVGWSKSDVIRFSQITGKNVEFKGSGYVKTQSVSEGKPIDFLNKITVTMKELNDNE